MKQLQFSLYHLHKIKSCHHHDNIRNEIKIKLQKLLIRNTATRAKIAEITVMEKIEKRIRRQFKCSDLPKKPKSSSFLFLLFALPSETIPIFFLLTFFVVEKRQNFGDFSRSLSEIFCNFNLRAFTFTCGFSSRKNLLAKGVEIMNPRFSFIAFYVGPS